MMSQIKIHLKKLTYYGVLHNMENLQITNDL